MADAHKFEATWESLKQFTVPAWYQDAKFGIFIHWGVYSVPCFDTEWYPRFMYQEGSRVYEHHIKAFGPHTEFGYKDFIPQFTMENYDPAAWADLFARSGAKYVVPVAEHHDGFAMYDTDYSRWSAAQMGPRRDVLRLLADAIRERGLVLGVSNHRAENWFFMDGGTKFDSDINDPQNAEFYGPPHACSPDDQGGPGWKSKDWRPRPSGKFLDEWLARCCELVDKYEPSVFWFDWWVEQAVFEPYLQKFAAYYYNKAQNFEHGGAVNFKLEAMPQEAGVHDVERGQLAGINPHFWQTDTAISKVSWGYIGNKQDYKTPGQLVGDLIDIVSKNGCLLLNVGPRPDGTIPEEEQRILLEIGQWLAINGEAIYGSRYWDTFGEGPTEVDSGSFSDNDRAPFTAQDFRFTQKDDALYVFCLTWPESEVVVSSMGKGSSLAADQIASVRMLGSDEELRWEQCEAGLRVTPLAEKPCDYAYTLKITLKDRA